MELGSVLGSHSYWKMLSLMCYNKSKTYAKHLLAILLGLCSLWLVWELCLKYLSGSTTILREQEHKTYLPLPHFLICNKQRYNKDELAAMELPDDFFDNRHPDKSKFVNRSSFPDLNATWQRATWPVTDFEMDWRKYEGMELHIINSLLFHLICYDICVGFNSSARLISVNTLFEGQCYHIMANKHESSPSSGTFTALMINLVRNHSVAWLYIIPSAQKSEISAALNRWNYPVRHFELHTGDFIKLTFNKEIHARQSSEGSTCTDLEEETYYKVWLNSFNLIT